MNFVVFLSLFSASISAAALGQGYNTTRAIYTLYNDPSGNNILSFAVSHHDGTLSSPILTPTGGKGLLGLNVGPPFGVPGSPAGPDGLFGSGSVVVSPNYLFTVNPGSNTLSMFAISSFDPTHPKLVGSPADTLGEFPMSVAYSERLRTACVLNGGARNGIACFSVNAEQGLSPIGGLRPLTNLHTATPPSGPPSTASEVLFNPSSTALFVITKGSAGPPAVQGYIYVFAVDSHGQVSTTPVISSSPNLTLDFSINFLGSDTSALITDPSFGASVVSITPDLQVIETQHVVIANQFAACWGAYSRRYDSAYVIDTGHPNITILDPRSGNIKGAIQYDVDAKGGFDTVISRQWLYLLTGDSSVLVIDLERNGGREVQHYSLQNEGLAGHWQGMAAYPPESF